MGALYSNTDDLSSPIHRTEGKFHADGDEDTVDAQQTRKPNQRFGKLAALANTINQWEDDTSHHATTATANTTSSVAKAPPKPELPSRGRIGKETKTLAPIPPPLQKLHTKTELNTQIEKEKVKQLKWDPKVINSLEAQGFQRRESSTVKVSYEFAETKDDKMETTNEIPEKPKEIVEEKRIVGKLTSDKFAPITSSQVVAEKKIHPPAEKKLPNVKSGLVSGRAAIFESQAQNLQQQQQKPQKDPTELSLKERMKLFEKNKGEALVPKAAFGMAPAISKIIPDTNQKKEEITKGKKISIYFIFNISLMFLPKLWVIFKLVGNFFKLSLKTCLLPELNWYIKIILKISLFNIINNIISPNIIYFKI